MLDGLIFKKVKGAWDAPYKIGDRTKEKRGELHCINAPYKISDRTDQKLL